MPCAGIWTETPLRPGVAERMLRSFAHPSWRIRSTQDLRAGIALAAAGVESSVPADFEHPGGIRISGDVQLDDPAELGAALGLSAKDYAPAWLVAEAYRRWGLEFPSRLYGDFGFALWDPRLHRLMLVRDAGGARPLFYAADGAWVAYASQPRGLLCLSEVSRQLEERAVLDHLGELPQEEAATLFAAIRRVPPASALVVERRASRVFEYLDITQTPELRLRSDRDYAAALKAELSRAVHARSRGACAVMLSGGLDSSAIAALASESGRHLTTISAVFPEFAECDERPYQAALVSRLATTHHEIEPRSDGPAGDFERLCRVFSLPNFIGPHWLAFAVAEVAQRERATTVLSGIDGDRVVSHGGGRYADLARARDFRGLARELRAVDDISWARRARVFGVQAILTSLPGALSETLERLDPRPGLDREVELGLIHPHLVERHGLRQRLRALPRRPRSTREDHAQSLRAPDRNWDVELLDELGTAFGLSFAQPFFDRRVMELCFSFPGSQKRSRGLSRYVLRNALRGSVPELILNRRRDAALDRPHWRWIRAWLTQNPLPDSVLGALSPYVDVPRVSERLFKLPHERARGPVDFLWRCVILSRWLCAPGLPTPESFQSTVQRS